MTENGEKKNGVTDWYVRQGIIIRPHKIPRRLFHVAIYLLRSLPSLPKLLSLVQK